MPEEIPEAEFSANALLLKSPSRLREGLGEGVINPLTPTPALPRMQGREFLEAANNFPAMIMAAGLGKRMRAYNDALPKPMVPVAGKPLIDYTLALLRHAGIDRAVVNTHYKPEVLEDFLHRQQDFTLHISREETLLETGGGIKKALPLLSESFFVLNSDVICRDITPPILMQMLARWNDATMDALLLVIPTQKAVGYTGKGDFCLAADGSTLLPFQPDKPAYVFTGVQRLHQRFLATTPEGAFSLSPLYQQALRQSPCRLHAVVHSGEWYHVGDGEGVRLAETSLMQG